MRSGEVPLAEELRERWRTAEIVRLLGERFPGLAGVVSGSLFSSPCFFGASTSSFGIHLRLCFYISFCGWMDE